MNKRIFLSILALTSINGLRAMQELDKALLRKYIAEQGIELVQSALHPNDDGPTAVAKVDFSCALPLQCSKNANQEEKMLMKQLIHYWRSKEGSVEFQEHMTEKTECHGSVSVFPVAMNFNTFKITYTQKDLDQLLLEQKQ